MKEIIKSAYLVESLDCNHLFSDKKNLAPDIYDMKQKQARLKVGI